MKAEEKPFIEFYRALGRAFFDNASIVLIDYICLSGG